MQDNEILCSLLLKYGADLNAPTQSGVTPLMFVSGERVGALALCKLFLQQTSISRSLKDKELGGTPLHYACKTGTLETCKLLLEHGFDANDTAYELSCLHLACYRDDSRFFDLFLKAQKDPNMKDKEGNTPLHSACEQGRLDLVKKLLLKETGERVDVNAYSLSGKTPLHRAVEKGHTDIVELLLIYRAKPNEIDMHRKTPLMYALEFGHAAIGLLLKKRISIVEFNAAKPYLAALARGNKELEKVIGTGYEELVLSEPTTSSFVTSPLQPSSHQLSHESKSVESFSSGIRYEQVPALLDDEESIEDIIQAAPAENFSDDESTFNESTFGYDS